MKCPKCQFENPDDSMFCSKCGSELEVIQKAPVGATETVATSIEELTTGSTFADRYQVIEELGKGGMGSVYKVHDTQLNEKVALKLIKPEIASDKKVITRFSNELKLARKISHPGVGRMYELMDHRGTRFITMEYVPGEDLRSMIRMSGQLGIGTAIGITKQVCEGLTEAHRLGVIHRDLKPSNIMIDKTGQARIMDFGIARSIEAKRITGAGIMIGTPEYMSPEQVEGKETDKRSDIYSLGVILYEMLTGRVPFEGDTPFTVGVKHKSEVPEDPKTFNSGIPDDLSRVILRCLEKEKDNRFQTTGELCAALGQIEEGIPTTEWEVARKKTQTSQEITVTFKKNWIFIAVPIVLVLAAALAFLFLKKEKVVPVADAPQPHLVVLPFENRMSAEDANYVDGISNEIRNRLSFIEGLKVIGSNTATNFKKSGKTAIQIGEESDIDYVLGGDVFGEKEDGKIARVRIQPELTRTTDGTILPLKAFERSSEDDYMPWAEIAEEIASQLDIVIRGPEIEALEAKLTDNAEAHNSYLSGLGYMNIRYEEESLKMAIQMFERAVELDPSFAHAYGNLSRCHSLMHQHGFDMTEERASLAKAAADKMEDLQPDLPETHLALGSYYYWCLRDYDQALDHLNIARKGLPRDSEVLSMIAYIRRRQNDFDEAIKLLTLSIDMDPQNWRMALELGNTEQALRNYERSKDYYSRAISLEPSNTRGYLMKGLAVWLESGDISKVVEVIETMPEKNDSAIVLAQYLLKMGEKDFQAALGVLDESPFDVFQGFGGFSLKESLEGAAYAAMERMDEARDSFDQARLKFENLINERPEDPRLRSSLAKHYAFLGRRDDALYEARRAMELYPVSLDAFSGPAYVSDYAEVLVMLGEYEEALEKIDYLLSIPGSSISVATLQNQPSWEPLHDHPRFKEIVEKYSK